MGSMSIYFMEKGGWFSSLFLGGEYYCFIMHRIVKGYDIHEKGKTFTINRKESSE
jgi:hypothetical protein